MSATTTAVSATTSPVFRSWLLWGSLAFGGVYGFLRDRSLTRAAAVRKEQEKKKWQAEAFDRAREAFAKQKLQAATVATVAPGIVTDPDSPDFDLEKLILHFFNDESASTQH